MVIKKKWAPPLRLHHHHALRNERGHLILKCPRKRHQMEGVEHQSVDPEFHQSADAHPSDTLHLRLRLRGSEEFSWYSYIRSCLLLASSVYFWVIKVTLEKVGETKASNQSLAEENNSERKTIIPLLKLWKSFNNDL